ncbi:F-box/LRR-repeat protein at4g14103 [Phtheirospermum japonicum]|uniref:F-box/LRR-repeat protein at4g14103 n=1 Tax=Phtheirospermum japonicum TaxID=374723 RepID=A0A830D7W0_9LAMI|nr:F-box/LRR-repeat protein at4g14103 [Phtheirospermum japonicum]
MSSIDRLSALPDGILIHILTFLPTNLSVSTSILSRRWRFLWAYVPSLNFENVYFHRERIILDIVNKVLSLYKAPIMNSFRLFYPGDGFARSKSQLETCFSAVIQRNVKTLDLFVPSQDILPRGVFTCKTLVDLRLAFSGGLHMTGDVHLPALKSLQLTSVSHESDLSLARMLSGCPVLEELIVHCSDMVCCDISSPTIKNLVLRSKFYDSLGREVKINTPKLKYLQLWGLIPVDVSAGTLDSLIDVKIAVDDITLIQGPGILYSQSVLKLVGGLCNVKCLTLLSGRLIVPDSAFSALTTKFHDLTKLELAGDGRFLSYFLGNADNLEVLTIRGLAHMMEPHQEPTCALSNLRTVTIDQFGCTEHEFGLIRCILWSAKVLKRMEIYIRGCGIDLKGKFEALKKISLFPRGSVACELVFH